MSRDRSSGGHYTTEYTEADVLDVFDEVSIPVVTSREVADALDCSPDTARKNLEALVEDGPVVRKRVGGRAVVYVRIEEGANRQSGYGEWKQSLWDG